MWIINIRYTIYKVLLVLQLITISTGASSNDEKLNESGSGNIFRDESGAGLEQCPCVRENGQTICASYDASVQAATLEEALLNFKDLTLDDSSSEQIAATSTCEEADAECRACTGQMLSLLQANGHISYSQLFSLSQKMGVKSGDIQKACTKYKFARRIDNWLANYQGTQLDASTFSMLIQNAQKIASDVDTTGMVSMLNSALSIFSNQGTTTRPAVISIPRFTEFWRNSSTEQNNTLSNFFNARQSSKRSKRQVSIGTVWKMNCVGRGEPDNSNELSLCTQCWQWRVLPSNYFPRYINELTCDSDLKCLNGYGQCSTRRRTISVLKDEGTWVATDIYSDACCDCKVNKYSTLHSWISQ